MPLNAEIEEALHSTEPVSRLRSFASRMSTQGYDKPAILEIFEKAREQLREAGRENDEDVVMDVMDFLVDWCSPHMQIEGGNDLNNARRQG